MKKIILIIFILLINVITTFGKINDGLTLFKKEEIESLDKKISEIEYEYGLKIYINTLPDGEGFTVDDPQRTIMLNILQGEDKTVRVLLNFSRDLEIEDYSDDVDLILDNSEELLKSGKLEEYVAEIFDDLKDDVLTKLREDEFKDEELEEIMHKEPFIKFELNFKKIMILALVFIGAALCGLKITSQKVDKYDSVVGDSKTVRKKKKKKKQVKNK